MGSLDEKMTSVSELVLKRSLSDEERLEIYQISDALGMGNVQSFLHQLLVFKMHEDTMKRQFDQLALFESRLNKKFDEIGVWAAQIDETLKASIEKILGEGAEKIGRDMGGHIAESAKETLGARDDYQFLRGQVFAICLIGILSALAYWMGESGIFLTGDSKGFFNLLFTLPAGWWAFLCCSLHTFMWAYDHWKQLKKSTFYKSIFILQCLITVLLIIFLL